MEEYGLERGDAIVYYLLVEQSRRAVPRYPSRTIGKEIPFGVEVDVAGVVDN